MLLYKKLHQEQEKYYGKNSAGLESQSKKYVLFFLKSISNFFFSLSDGFHWKKITLLTRQGVKNDVIKDISNVVENLKYFRENLIINSIFWYDRMIEW